MIFSASRGWFEKFKARIGTHNVKFTGEAASADKDAAPKFSACFKKIEENMNNYDDRQIFNVDKTGLYWGKMPSRTFFGKNKQSQPGYKVSKYQYIGVKQTFRCD
jgi:hypothetical protein